MTRGLVVLVAIAACGEPRAPGVVVWHAYAGAEREALEATVRALEATTPERRVDLVAVPYEALADKLTSAIPNGNGPDLFVFPGHDRIGDWVASGLLEPIEYYVDDALADRFLEDSLAALAYQGSLYGLPLAVKSLALYYRTDLVDAPPTTTDELVAIGRRLTGAGRYGLVYRNDLYGHAPWLHGFGGRLFDDAGEVDLDGRGALDAAEFARALGGPGGIVPPGVDGAAVATLFGAGRAAMAVSGPWLAAELEPGVPWAVATLPIVSATGLPARPFLGVEGVLMSSRVRDKNAAFAVLAALTSDDGALLRARDAGQVVANRAAYEASDVAADPVLTTFRRQAELAVIMPATPAMRMVWTPYESALQAIVAQGARPDDVLAAAEREVAGYVAGAAAR